MDRKGNKKSLQRMNSDLIMSTMTNKSSPTKKRLFESEISNNSKFSKRSKANTNKSQK